MPVLSEPLYESMTVPSEPLYLRVYGRRIVHSVRAQRYGGIVLTDCGRSFEPNGRNDASTKPYRWYGEGVTWRECKPCAARVGHFDLVRR